MIHNDSTIPVSPLYVKNQMEVLMLVKARWEYCNTVNLQRMLPEKQANNSTSQDSRLFGAVPLALDKYRMLLE
ncbi:MAG TPA: hypothetical protein DIU00_04670 [Phycisphaerales bacterium]|nr:hypothetical protein [Phycisphaerales bacterium]